MIQLNELQTAFNKLFQVSSKALDADTELSEEECNITMTELWSILREVKPFYTGEPVNENIRINS